MSPACAPSSPAPACGSDLQRVTSVAVGNGAAMGASLAQPLLFLDWGTQAPADAAVSLAQAYGPLLLPVVQDFGLGVVLTSTRRPGVPLPLFAAEYGVLAPHVVGATRRVEHGGPRGRRELEIQAYLDAQGLGGEGIPEVAWVAVDAHPYGFVTRRRQLFGVRRERGLLAADIPSLRRRVARLIAERAQLLRDGSGALHS